MNGDERRTEETTVFHVTRATQRTYLRSASTKLAPNSIFNLQSIFSFVHTTNLPIHALAASHLPSKMRIRLLIERNELPPASVLWSFPPTQLTSTVAQFLEDVNVRFPLEGNTWGLEDYTVTLGGYEAQHYTKVGEVFKEDDEVVIKPLMFAEARARTISGRAQITADGRRLVDGVPFGKPLLKRMRRPEVNIPPARKRARIEGEEEQDEGAMVRFEEVEEEDDEEDEDDEDFEDAGEDSEDDDEDEGDDGDDNLNDSYPTTGQKLLKPHVKLWEDAAAETSSSESASEQDDAEQAKNASSDDSSDSSDSDSSSDGSSSSSSDDEVGQNDEDDDSSNDSSSEPPGSNTSWGGIDASESVTPAAAPDPPPALPHKGAARTKERNIRRREAARLKHLKKSGELPSSTTLQQMQDWIRTGELPSVSDSNTNGSQKVTEATKRQSEFDLELEQKRQQLINDINGGGIDVSSESKISTAAAVPTNMYPPQIKKSKKKSKVSTPLDDDDRPEEIPIATEPVVVYPVVASTPDLPAETPAAASQSAAAAKRRQDKAASEEMPTEGPKRVSAAQRLIYGSLGLKAPKTQADKDALQKKLTDRSRKSAAEVPAEEQEVEDEDPEAWREKVVISAVECLDEGVELSEPPFPFQQKWDPQYWSQNIKKRNASQGGGKNKKRKKNGGGDLVEVYDKYNQDGGGDALNYDDPVDEDEEEWDDGENWQDGALLGDEEEEDDGFPALPEDVTSLASLLEADAQPGDFVVFTEMACSDATGWQPQIVTTVACLDSRNDQGGWNLRFSKRGAGKEYDDEGNRVYKKFEMEGYDDEDETRLMEWNEMMDVKLLRRPDVVEEQSGEDVVDQTVGGGVDEQIQSQLEGEMGQEASSADQ